MQEEVHNHGPKSVSTSGKLNETVDLRPDLPKPET